MEKVRSFIFKRRQFEPAMIVASVNWYLRYSLSLRDVEELLIERGVSADRLLRFSRHWQSATVGEAREGAGQVVLNAPGCPARMKCGHLLINNL